MENQSFDLKVLFSGADIGDGKTFLSRTVFIPVKPEHLTALAKAGALLCIRSGMGGFYNLHPKYQKDEDGIYTFKVDHGDAKYEIGVTGETLPSNVLFRAAIPYGFKPEMAKESLLAHVWDREIEQSLSMACNVDNFTYRPAERLGVEKRNGFTGMDFLLNRVD